MKHLFLLINRNLTVKTAMLFLLIAAVCIPLFFIITMFTFGWNTEGELNNSSLTAERASVFFLYLPVLVILLFCAVRYLILSPVSKLSNSVLSFNGKRFDVRPETNSSDEIGVLVEKINRMADMIEEYSVTMDDMVQRKTYEIIAPLELLAESERMASLGILVAGIAHEINTPIGVAVTSSSYLSDRVAEMNRMYREDRICKEDFVEFMNLLNESSALILTNLHNASNLIESFKRVAVDQSTEGKRKFRLNGYLADIISSLAPRIKHTPHKILVECPDTIELDSYPGALTQIISNFVINSLIHGFEGRQQGIIKINCSINNNILQLQYTDNGSGIAPENLNNIFKPFFTTKRGQGGTGLGLHIVHNIVTQKLSGSIHCNSVYGKGVDFTIKFPVESL